MSRSRKQTKGPGFEYHSARPGNYNNSPGKGVKRETHKAERSQSRKLAKDETQ